jgi:hypothetical protein
MMEKWVLEKWDFGLLGIFFLTIKLLMFKNKKLPFKTNIPLFHHSMCEAKHQTSINSFNFSKL